VAGDIATEEGVDANLTAVIRLTRAVMPLMLEAGKLRSLAPSTGEPRVRHWQGAAFTGNRPGEYAAGGGRHFARGGGVMPGR
jgi:hypothetical protein